MARGSRAVRESPKRKKPAALQRAFASKLCGIYGYGELITTRGICSVCNRQADGLPCVNGQVAVARARAAWWRPPSAALAVRTLRKAEL